MIKLTSDNCLFNRIGYHIPMFAGFAIMFVSTISKSYDVSAVVLRARIMNIIGTVFSA